MNTRQSTLNLLRRLMMAKVPARTVGKPSGGWCVPSIGTGGDIVRVQVNKAHEATAVAFGGAAVIRFYPVGDNELECVIAGHVGGLVDVTVTSVLGVETIRNAFTYDNSVLVTLGILPTFGDPAGGTWVEIEVNSSLGATGALVDGVLPLTSFTILDSTHVGGYMPAHAAGVVPVDITVINASSESTLENAFTYAYDSLDWVARNLACPWKARDGGMLLHFLGQWRLFGGWNNLDPTWPGLPLLYTTNEQWSSPTLAAWTQDKTHDGSASDRPKPRHWCWLGKHTHNGVEYAYVIGGDHLSASDPDFSGAPSNGYQCDVWRTADWVNWERVTAVAEWAGRMLVICGSSPGKLWAFGGQNGLLGELAGACVLWNDLWCSEDGGETWVQVIPNLPGGSATQPSARGLQSQLVYWRGRMWLVSGGTYETAAVADRQYFREVWSFDPANPGAGWTQHADLPGAGMEYANILGPFRGRLWAVAGYSGDGYSGGGSSGQNIRLLWSTGDGERWRREETPPWVHTHAAGMAINDDDTEIGFVAGNGALTTAPAPPGVSPAYALVATPFYTATVLPTPKKYRARDAVLVGTDIVSIPDSGGGAGPDLVFGNVLGDATYNASDADFGGIPSANSNGGHFMKTAAPIDLSTFTVIIVGKTPHTPGSAYSWYAITGGPAQYAYEFGAIDGTVGDRVGRQMEVLRGGVVMSGSAVQIFDEDSLGHVYSTTFDGTAAGSEYTVDGAVSIPNDVANTGNPGSAPWSAVWRVGSDDGGTGSKPSSFVEIRIYRALNRAELRAAVKECLAEYPYPI